MSANTSLNNALYAVEEAKQRLRRIKNEIDDYTDIQKAIRELEEAEYEIERAKREVNS